MKTLSRKEAAQKLGLPVDEIGNHRYLITWGDAWTPERFWKHEALTQTEYDSKRKSYFNRALIRKISLS